MQADDSKDKGSALAFLILVIFVITLVVFSVATLSRQNLQNVSGKYWEERARYGALAGIQRSLTQLRANALWDHTFPGPGPGGDWVDVALVGDPNVTFSLQVVNRLNQNTGAWAPDNRTWIPPNSVWINSIGKLGFRTSSGVSSIVAVASSQRPVFNHSVFGTNSVVMNDFRAKAWHPVNEGDGDSGVGTNSVAASAITLANNSFVDGDAEAGVNGNATLVVSVDGTSSVDGTIKAAQEAKLVTGINSTITRDPTIGVPPNNLPVTGPALVMAPNVAQRSFQPDPGGTLTIPGPGDYYVQGSIHLDGANLVLDPTVTAEDPAVIYVEQDVNILNGSQVNWDTGLGQPGDPRRLQIGFVEYVPNSFANFHQSNEVSLMMGGLSLTMDLWESSVYGSVIANDVTATHSVVYYDIRNKDVPMDLSGDLTIISTAIQEKAEATAAAVADTTTGGPAPPGPAPAPPTTNPVAAPAPSVGDPPNPPPGPAPQIAVPVPPPSVP